MRRPLPGRATVGHPRLHAEPPPSEARKGRESGNKIETTRERGGHTILELAETNSADLIVMATHGRKGLERAIFGSTTERVMRSATCPVLAIPVKEETS